MAETNLEVLEEKMNLLEQRVFGSCDKDVDYPRIAHTLSKLNSQVDSKIAGRPKVETLMKRLGELERFLDPAYTDRLTLSNDAKMNIILAEEEELKKHAEMLAEVRDASNILSSEHLKVSPDLEKKLQDLCEIHIKQQDQTGEFCDDVKHLLQHYNSLIALISKQFIHWDEMLTKLEAAKQSKKISD